MRPSMPPPDAHPQLGRALDLLGQAKLLVQPRRRLPCMAPTAPRHGAAQILGGIVGFLHRFEAPDHPVACRPGLCCGACCVIQACVASIDAGRALGRSGGSHPWRAVARAGAESTVVPACCKGRSTALQPGALQCAGHTPRPWARNSTCGWNHGEALKHKKAVGDSHGFGSHWSARQPVRQSIRTDPESGTCRWGGLHRCPDKW